MVSPWQRNLVNQLDIARSVVKGDLLKDCFAGSISGRTINEDDFGVSPQIRKTVNGSGNVPLFIPARNDHSAGELLGNGSVSHWTHRPRVDK
jgi:hypothetical protein